MLSASIRIEIECFSAHSAQKIRKMRWPVVHIASGCFVRPQRGQLLVLSCGDNGTPPFLFFLFLPKLVDGSGVHSTPGARRGIECECPPFVALYPIDTQLGSHSQSRASRHPRRGFLIDLVCLVPWDYDSLRGQSPQSALPRVANPWLWGGQSASCLLI